MLILYINGMDSRVESTIAVHLIIMALKLLAQNKQCVLTPPVEDEEAYANFCKTVYKIKRQLTEESRSTRITNRTMQIARREESESKRSDNNNARHGGSQIDSESVPHVSRIRNDTSHNAAKRVKILDPLPNRDINVNKVQDKKDNSLRVNKSKKEKAAISQKASRNQNQSQSQSQGSQSKLERKLGPFVAHSTDVSKPGGASSILRAKTPLILDRPDNIRDQIMASPPLNFKDGKSKASANDKKATSSEKTHKVHDDFFFIQFRHIHAIFLINCLATSLAEREPLGALSHTFG